MMASSAAIASALRLSMALPSKSRDSFVSPRYPRQ
jgi:hypothetical protein